MTAEGPTHSPEYIQVSNPSGTPTRITKGSCVALFRPLPEDIRNRIQTRDR